MEVDETRVEEYKAAGYKLAADSFAPPEEDAKKEVKKPARGKKK